jgi:hypothetical protein
MRALETTVTHVIGLATLLVVATGLPPSARPVVVPACPAESARTSAPASTPRPAEPSEPTPAPPCVDVGVVWSPVQSPNHAPTDRLEPQSRGEAPPPALGPSLAVWNELGGPDARPRASVASPERSPRSLTAFRCRHRPNAPPAA